MLQRYQQNGRVDPPRRQRRRIVRDGPLRAQVEEALEEQPIQSVRGLARRLGKFVSLLEYIYLSNNHHLQMLIVKPCA